ncbi:homocysteine S-methyltransferase family protein [Alicyclobacillus cycloheptanicus]|uniref:Methionine synthase I (Cobalamin-dependent) n=1 Tax=Alicyclobacillus cycloheptanicus TaxID=1457 RepID=A0ABT9XH19_9BACL|nr:homocysteine S-methyltransferase family protein [Alicyclobacillus cycloheptanicus]MDQ0189334.1 methionine synthase I (cobalamin-dependent) [Alicyclobacillus cycloheptanicus]
MEHRSHPFLGRLRRGVLIGDGAMATLLHQWGVPIRTCYEALSVTAPATVQKVHAAYLAAGADVLQTNTFGAHRSGLGRYGRAHEVASLNHAAVRAARAAVAGAAEDLQGRQVFVLGTVGSIVGARAAGAGLLDAQVRADLCGEYEEQMSALLEAGVDGLLLETFADAEEMVFAIEVARRLTDLPIVANLSPEAVGVTRDGVSVRAAFLSMQAAGADVVGLNCRLGPAGILRTYEAEPALPEGLYAAVPNAGLLHVVEGDYAYTGSADYFAQTGVRLAAQGVRLLGGLLRNDASACAEIGGAGVRERCPRGLV